MTTPRRTAAWHGAAMLLLAAPVTACSMIPTPPESLPDGWIPAVAPSALDEGLLESAFGFTPEQGSAVRVRNNGCDDFATGSGFVLDEHTIVTNRHVVQGYGELEVSRSDGTTVSVTGAETATIGDLALVTTSDHLDHPVTLGSDPELGESVAVVGYPGGRELTVTEGTVWEEVEDTLDNAATVYETTAAGEPGSSGSAVYDVEGLVVGVLYAGNDYGRSYIIPVSILREMVADASVRTAVPAACAL